MSVPGACPSSRQDWLEFPMDIIRRSSKLRRPRSCVSRNPRSVFASSSQIDGSPSLASSPSSGSQGKAEFKEEQRYGLQSRHDLTVTSTSDSSREGGLSHSKGNNDAHCRVILGQSLDMRNEECRTFKRRSKCRGQNETWRGQNGRISSAGCAAGMLGKIVLTGKCSSNSIAMDEQNFRLQNFSIQKGSASTSKLSFKQSALSLFNNQKGSISSISQDKSVIEHAEPVIHLDSRTTLMDLLKSSRVSTNKRSQSGNSQAKKNGHSQDSLGMEARVYGRKGSHGPLNSTLPGTGGKLKVGGVACGVQSSASLAEKDSQGNERDVELAGPYLKKASHVKSSTQIQQLTVQESSEDGGSNGSKEGSFDGNEFGEESPEAICRLGIPKPVEAPNSQTLAAIRKSSRVPKKRVLDGDEDTEVDTRRKRKKKIELEVEPTFVENDRQHNFDSESNGESHRAQKKQGRKLEEPCTPELDSRRGLPLTARQRALKISKEGGDPEAGTGVEALAPPSSKRQNEVFSETEQAVKKEAAARRRKLQMEKNAKEIQEVAIQKILGQESSRRKREEKIQKQRQELEQEKQAAALTPAVNTIRWVMGPSGNVVSFSKDLELPKIFSGPCSYPQERERCAGPSCNNTYKYRDAKTLLPLCSLQCYRAVRNHPGIAPRAF